MDRIIIERSLLTEAKRRNLYLTYYPAWEYIYLERYAQNTFLILLKKWDRIPFEVLTNIADDVKEEFPNWFKNNYYKEHPFLKRIFLCGIIEMPRVTACLYKLYLKVCKAV